MSSRPHLRLSAVLLLALAGAACGSAQSRRVLTVEEAVPRIDELNGRTVSVTGYLPKCYVYDCTLYRTKADADAWDRAVADARANKRFHFPDNPSLGIGTGGKGFEFDAKAAPFTKSYVVITGTITNKCRIDGKPSCTDRGPDLEPATIRRAT
jgi:hypothetical protein